MIKILAKRLFQLGLVYLGGRAITGNFDPRKVPGQAVDAVGGVIDKGAEYVVSHIHITKGGIIRSGVGLILFYSFGYKVKNGLRYKRDQFSKLKKWWK